MDKHEYEKLVLLELKHLHDKVDRLTDIAEENQRYLEDIIMEEESFNENSLSQNTSYLLQEAKALAGHARH